MNARLYRGAALGARTAWGTATGLLALVAGLAVGAPSNAVDVSGYPPEIQKAYRVVADKCSRCHALSRPLGATYTSEAQWRTVVAQMARRPGAGISRQDQDESVKFLVYHAQARAAKRQPPPAANPTETRPAPAPKEPASQPAPPPSPRAQAQTTVVTRDGLRIEALVRDPQAVRRLRDGRWVDEAPRAEETLYLVVRLVDEETREKIPYAQVSARVVRESAETRTLMPALGPDGFHYGANLAAPAGPCRVSLTIEPPPLAQVGGAALRLTQPITLEIDLVR